MEATDENLGFLFKIQPPRLEDAGLEDCALPPDSIHQAFLKAAVAVGSRAASVFTTDEDDVVCCIADPSPEKSTPSDALVGINSEGSCVTEKGGVLVGEGASDLRGEMKGIDKVVVVGGGGYHGCDCVEGLKGLKIKVKCKDDDDDDKKPTLIEGCFMNP